MYPNGNCDGSIVHGADFWATIGAGEGRSFMRFDLSPLAANALLAGQVKSMTLKLSRNDDCEGVPTTCSIGTNLAGTFQVFPLRNDWVEGTSAPYSGADWCRRSNVQGVLWNAPGANGDHGAAAATLSFDPATNSSAQFQLDPSKWDSTWVVNNQISILVVASSGKFIQATKDSTLYARPSLDVVVCE